jgi:hypothetical protein
MKSNRAHKKKSSEGRLARYQNVRAELSNQAPLSRFNESPVDLVVARGPAKWALRFISEYPETILKEFKRSNE